jgi:predicted DCC family thiol-disulfide oxidoreductase YuxK
VPVLVYDGDCGFCTWSARFGARRLPASVVLVAFQDADLGALGVSLADAERAVQWVGDGGRPLTGHRAIAAWLIASGLPWSVAGVALLMPPVSWIAAVAYRVIAANRSRIPGPWRRSGASCGTG